MNVVVHLLAGSAIAASYLNSRQRRSELAKASGDLSGHRERPPETTRWGVLATAVVSAVGPDVDVVWPPRPGREDHLFYMVDHRGYTHTVLVGLAMAAFIAAVVCLVSRRDRRHFLPLWAIAGASVLSHLVLDFTNDYGVHPFWPWGEWFYGDFVFLGEPLVLGALLPWGLWHLRGTRDAKPGRRSAVTAYVVLVAVPLVWTLFQALRGEWTTLIPALASIVATVALVLWQRRWTPRTFAWLGWSPLLSTLLVFFVGSRLAKSEVRELLAARHPDERIVHVVTTPASSNPFCWRIVTAGYVAETDAITTRIGTFSLWPALTSPESCFVPNRTLPPNAMAAPERCAPKDANEDTDRWHLVGELSGRGREFERLASSDPGVRATMHFLRAPYWRDLDARGTGERRRVLLGDLRFDYEPSLKAFCKYVFTVGEPEPRELEPPPWNPPFFSDVDLSERPSVPPEGELTPCRR